jgi:hypothetical protein
VIYSFEYHTLKIIIDLFIPTGDPKPLLDPNCFKTVSQPTRPIAPTHNGQLKSNPMPLIGKKPY